VALRVSITSAARPPGEIEFGMIGENRTQSAAARACWWARSTERSPFVWRKTRSPCDRRPCLGSRVREPGILECRRLRVCRRPECRIQRIGPALSVGSDVINHDLPAR
jgi:hypothetical protein